MASKLKEPLDDRIDGVEVTPLYVFQPHTLGASRDNGPALIRLHYRAKRIKREASELNGPRPNH